MARTPPFVIIGCGIVGVLTAYALAKRGKSVCVVDRASQPAQMCSYANAGILAVGHAKSWAGPGAIGSIGRAMFGHEPGVKVTRLADPALLRWGASFLVHCSHKAHLSNTAKLQKLSRYSRDLTKSIEADLGLTPELRHDGGLYLFQDEAQFAAYSSALERSGEGGFQVLGRQDLIAREPSLAGRADQFAGGIFSPYDSVGDCRLFASRVATALIEKFDVNFQFETNVSGFERRDNRIRAVLTDTGPIPAEAVILTTGADTPALMRPLGVAPHIYPVKGYSGSWRILDDARIPTLPFVDETALMAVAAYGGQLRVTALAEFAGFDRSLPDDRTALLRDYVACTFGDAVDADSADFWSGLRPSTPAGPPYLGRIRKFENLWINAGHGQLGWTMAAGCADLIAERITGHDVDVEGVSATARWLEEI
ncbi:FAD-dependent oxidoreductase [Celeribacter baekdonensis]|uniref:FAD-dependent oxidoreductase n=1 Tax=Celeribacter baekdonensis TaxID=875171 RepID=UPI0030D89030|tara:strand:- start:70822 stop:72093 length:1272 start_codon:yes stop_codon:yes gene_type:complete